MKKRLAAGLLVCALVVSLMSVAASAADNLGVKAASATNSNATVEITSDKQGVKVTYTGAKDEAQYVVVATGNKDGSTYKPTNDSLVYLNQTDAQGASGGKVEFTVMPMIDKLEQGKTYGICLVGSDGSGMDSALEVATFDWDAIIDLIKRYFGDFNDDGDIKVSEVMRIINARKNDAVTDEILKFADINNDGEIKVAEIMRIINIRNTDDWSSIERPS